MQLFEAMETGSNGFSAGAAEHAWRPPPFTLPPFLSHTGRGRGNVGWLERKNVDTLTQWSHEHGTFAIRNPGFCSGSQV